METYAGVMTIIVVAFVLREVIRWRNSKHKDGTGTAGGGGSGGVQPPRRMD
jgi:hypothetical protein